MLLIILSINLQFKGFAYNESFTAIAEAKKTSIREAIKVTFSKKYYSEKGLKWRMLFGVTLILNLVSLAIYHLEPFCVQK